MNKKTISNSNNFNGKIIELIEERYNNKLIIKQISKHLKIIAFTEKNSSIKKGDKIYIKKKLKKLNPDKKFNLNWIKQGFHYYVFLNKNDYKIISKRKTGYFQHIKNILNNKIEKIFVLETANFLKAIFMGNKSFLSKVTITTFKRAGVLHILALSGLHIGIITLILVKIMNLLKLNQKLIYFIISVTILSYLEITTKPVSLLRAAIMIWIYSFLFINNLNKNIINILFISAFIILIIAPEKLFSLGFQLSFIATLGIITFYKKLEKMLPALPFKISESLSISISAQLLTIPIIAFHMQEVNINGLIANILAVPIVFLIILLAIITIPISAISLATAKIIANICTFCLNLLIKYCQYIGNLPGYFSIDNFYLFFLIYLIILFFFLQKKFMQKKVLTLLITIIVTIFIINFIIKPSSNFIIKEKNNLIVLHENKTLIIYGKTINNKNFNLIQKQYINNNYKNIYICLTSTEWETLNNFTRIIKKYPISRCYIISNFSFSNRFKRFISLIEIEKISLFMVNFKKVVEYNNEKLIYKCILNYSNE